jgi:hypothetical protein
VIFEERDGKTMRGEAHQQQNKSSLEIYIIPTKKKT